MATPDANARAGANLVRVVKNLGAEMLHEDDVRIKCGDRWFRVQYRAIYREDKPGSYDAQTCYEDVYCPPSECIASALLLLHNNPAIFEFWRSRPGRLCA